MRTVMLTVLFSLVMFQDGDRKIVPWERIGLVKLGMTRAEVVGTLGKPSLVVEGARLRYDYDQSKLLLMIHFTPIPDQRVESILTRSPNFKTADGLGVGSSGNDVTEALGKDYRTWPDAKQVSLCYESFGIWLDMTSSNTVRTFSIHHSGYKCP